MIFIWGRALYIQGMSGRLPDKITLGELGSHGIYHLPFTIYHVVFVPLVNAQLGIAQLLQYFIYNH